MKYTSLNGFPCLPLSQRPPSFVPAVSTFLFIVLAVPSRLPPIAQPPHLHAPPHTITPPLAVSGHLTLDQCPPVSHAGMRKEREEGGRREEGGGRREGGTELHVVVVRGRKGALREGGGRRKEGREGKGGGRESGEGRR